MRWGNGMVDAERDRESERKEEERRRKKEPLTSQEEQQTLYNNTQIKLTTSRFPISFIYTPFFYAEDLGV